MSAWCFSCTCELSREKSLARSCVPWAEGNSLFPGAELVGEEEHEDHAEMRTTLRDVHNSWFAPMACCMHNKIEISLIDHAVRSPRLQKPSKAHSRLQWLFGSLTEAWQNDFNQPKAALSSTVLCIQLFKESISARTRDIWYTYGAAPWGFACMQEMWPAHADIRERQSCPEDWELRLPCVSHTMIWYAPTAQKWHGQLSCLRDYPLQPQEEATASLPCRGNPPLPFPHHSPLPLLAQQGQGAGWEVWSCWPPWAKPHLHCIRPVWFTKFQQEQSCGNINPGITATVLACLFRQWAQSQGSLHGANRTQRQHLSWWDSGGHKHQHQPHLWLQWTPC